MNSVLENPALFHVRVSAFNLGLSIRDGKWSDAIRLLPLMAAFLSIKAATCPATKPDKYILSYEFKRLVSALDVSDLSGVRHSMTGMLRASGLV